MTISEQVFKAYDIRGIAGETITPEFARHLGRAFVQVTKASSVAVGYDARLSSPELSKALMEGLTEAGANVVNLGMVASDMVYFSTGQYDHIEAGIMVTASHNPGEYNGFKACLDKAVPLAFDDIKKVMLAQDELPVSDTPGAILEEDIYDAWVSFVLGFVNPESIPAMKVVVDAGNGVAGKVCEQLFAKLPQIEMIPLYFEPDGQFPNHPAYPIVPENLVDLEGRMEQEEADLGLAFDGDADRIVLVDDQYDWVNGTVMTAMIIDRMMEQEHDAQQTFIYNALVGQVAKDVIAAHGAIGVRSRVGHLFVKSAMKEHGAMFGGEHSAHYFFREFWNADSGIIAALVVMELLGEKGQSLSQLRTKYETYYQSGEINFEVEDRAKVLELVRSYYEEQEVAIDDLDGITVTGDSWWLNVRPSNTEPLIRLNVEAKQEERMLALVEEAKKVIQ